MARPRHGIGYHTWWEGYCMVHRTLGLDLLNFRYAVIKYRPRISAEAWAGFKAGVRDALEDHRKAVGDGARS